LEHGTVEPAARSSSQQAREKLRATWRGAADRDLDDGHLALGAQTPLACDSMRSERGHPRVEAFLDGGSLATRKPGPVEEMDVGSDQLVVRQAHSCFEEHGAAQQPPVALPAPQHLPIGRWKRADLGS
jgi:hypothetical protein